MSNVWHLEKAPSCDRNRFSARILPSVLVLFAMGLTTSCVSVSTPAPASSLVNNATDANALALTPDTATVASQGQVQFTARISGSSNTAVTWMASGGSISSSGLFTAPQVSASTPIVVTATSSGSSLDPVMNKNVHLDSATSSRASATVMVNPRGGLTIVTSTLPDADVSVPYSGSLAASGGTAPYQWSIASGSLPSGIQLQGSNGVIAGTTEIAGSFPLTAKVVDAVGHSASASMSLVVDGGTGNGNATYDGPAELPRVYIQTAMADTPAPGTTIAVNAGGDLQGALNNANCGDTIQLQAGATFTGTFTFPAKSCDENHWIIVRTSSDDSLLPPQGTRLTPCYAGVSSLPGRPALNCTSVKNVTAKLLLPSSDIGPVIFASGAGYYRLVGLEITRAGKSGFVSSLASIVNNGTASNLIFDRVWMHGTPQDDTNRGLWLQGGTYVSAIDSYFTDFHCVSATGACSDSQAIAGGLGAPPMGPYKITDNFLEASGENVMFGGGSATGTPADIQISQNHMFKPLTWMQGQPGYVGGSNGNPFVVKNLLELKNAQRVLIDSNLMDDSWGGFSQSGFAILVGAKDQSIGNGNVCPICETTDITIRYTSVSHVGAGLQLANALSDNGGAALAGERYSIHDIVVDDINGTFYNGSGEFAQVSTSAGAPLLQSVMINHVTAFPPSTLLMVGDELSASGAMKNFTFTNNLVNAATYPIWSTGEGGAANCAYYDVPLTTFVTCFTTSTFSSNAFITPPTGSSWPAGNFFPKSAASVQFTNYNGGNGGNYQLLPSSPYKNKGTDGKDLGADIGALNAAIAGVQ